MKKVWLLSITVLIMVAGCKDPKEATMLRIKNTSQYDFSSILVESPGGSANYAALSAGNYSDYKEVEYTYSYAYIKVLINGDEFILQPIDYVGERKYKKGKYTFELGIQDYAARQLTLKFVEE